MPIRMAAGLIYPSEVQDGMVNGSEDQMMARY
uniref:Uncharacterized protein n=1 Tax=Arundo donax TaxID=35708 RepID=A0A0A9A6W7_ARUDO